MTIYVVMVEDRHVDTEAHLFSTAEKALDYARQVAADYDYPEEEAEADGDVMDVAALKDAGWLYYRALSPEGDCVWVLPKEVDDPDA